MQEKVLQGYRLSPQQRNLWGLMRREKEARYQAKCAVAIKGQLDTRHLKAAAEYTAARHEILRTTFQRLPGMTIPIQVINETNDILWQEDNLSESNEQATLIESLFQAASSPFDLEHGPLLSLHLIKTAQDEHVMIVRLPAICADSISLRNLVDELSRSYAAAACGKELNFNVMQYADLAEWQNGLIESEETRAGREYWQSRNLLRSPMPQLAFENVQRGLAAFEPGLDEFVIAPQMATQIESLARSLETPPDRILLACWRILLWRHTGQSEIEVGAVFDGRRATEIEGALGLFAKYLPVTSRSEEGLQFSELIEQLDRSFLTVRERQEYFSWDQFGDPPANALRASFFPFCFETETVFHNFTAGDLSFTIFKQYTCIDCFKLKLSYVRRPNELVVEFHYNSQLYRAVDIRRLMGHCQVLLENVIANPAAKIGELEMLTGAERQQLFVEYNSTKTVWPQDKFVHELFWEQATRTPEATAVIYEGEQLTYHELNERASKLANYLCKMGVGPEVIVGLCLERSLDLVVGLLAVLKAGGAYLPLDPSYPQARLTWMIEDAGVAVILAQTHLHSRLPSMGRARVVHLDILWESISQTNAHGCATTLWPDNLAYVIYTSGSTGKPKGVMLRHGALKNYLLWAISYYPLDSGCGAPVHSSLNFDLTITALFPPLLVGGYVHLLSTENEVEVLGAALSRRPGYGLVKLTPAHLQLLAEQLNDVELGGAARSLVIGGENLPAQAVRWWQERVSTARLFNEYGPTESVVGCSVYEVGTQAEVEAGRITIPIGRPIANTRLYILDARQRPAPQGVTGELCIGGEGLARGYLNHPDLTAERFVPDPGDTGDRLYRSGDLARYLRDGQIECLGRMDEQVKVRGYRIELGEIEAVLRDLPGVREAASAVRSEGGQSRLIGYVVGSEGQKLDIARLRQELQERLPDYMIPSALITLDALPLTANGKIDRKRLLELNDVQRLQDQEYAEARTPVEEMLVGIFEEVLKVDRVGIYDNFFGMGGHSLSATQVISRVKNRFGVEIGVRSIFQEPTIAGLGRKIEGALRAGERAEAPPLAPVSREGKLPLSFAQRRLWFLDQLVPNSPFYNCPGAMRLEGRLDLDIWDRVINEVIRRHETLRTRFEVKEGEPAQVIDAWEPRKLERIDLTSLPHEEKEEEVIRIAREEAETGFDLSRGPLLRVKVLKLGEEEHVVFYTMHHIVSDEWSMGILIREVESLYQAYGMGGAGSTGDESPLPELEIQYADFAVWQRSYLAGAVLENEIGYWREQLKGAAVLELPTDRSRPPEPSYRGGRKMIRLGRPLSEDLKMLSRREGATLYMAHMAAFKALLMRYSGQEDISVGTAIANRGRREIEGLIGFFVNMLVMRTDLSGNPSFRELIKREREVALEAYAHQEVPFEKLVEELNPERDLSRSPLFQVMMALQYAGQETSNLMGGKPVGIRSGVGMIGEAQAAQFDLTLSIMDLGRELAVVMEYSRDLFEAETIERLINHYTNVLDEIARDIEKPISELSLLSDQEREQVILGWNGTANPYPEDRCIHHLFEQQMERAPEAVAVVSDEGCLSYGELNRRANQLARYLRGLGIGPEAVVGVFLERSVEMVVGLLGVLKAGGAYLPLDPTYPAERLSFMLEDAAARLIVTHEKLRRLLEGAPAELICLDSSRSEIVRESEEYIDSGVNGENLAYVIYTSGSTGFPKGTMITHRSVVNLVVDAVRKFRLGPESRFLQFASLSFDVAVEEIYPVWSIGGSVVLLLDDASYSYSELTATIEKHEVTTMELPTTYWREWMRELLRTHSRAPRCLDLVITGDERISSDIFMEWKEHQVSLLHVYGVTEATVNSIVYPVPEDFGEGGSLAAIPIGKPIANTEVYLLDGRLQLTPLRIPGEVYLGGVGLARGYLNRPELTAERFVPSPFGKQAGSRLYSSGDLARSSESGWIEFIGRTDAQVKLRGYRIELGEIESQLARHPAIREAVAQAREDNHGDKRLVAYYTVAKTDGLRSTVEAETLRGYLSSALPGYMVPVAYVELESLPLTPNGKLNRHALPQPDGAGAARKYEAPVGEIETTLARIWSEALNLDQVSRHDNFFALGGHSLLALRLIERMRSEGLKTDVRTLFIIPTLAELAAGMEKGMEKMKEIFL